MTEYATTPEKLRYTTLRLIVCMTCIALDRIYKKLSYCRETACQLRMYRLPRARAMHRWFCGVLCSILYCML